MPIITINNKLGTTIATVEANDQRDAILKLVAVGANLGGANLGGADLGGADLDGANLRHANLRHADLEGADLRHADLNGVDLNGANLDGADLDGANLRHADLRHADLEGADLRHADLNGADLRHANLDGANLRHANLDGANLDGANLPYFQICPQEGAFIAYKKALSGETHIDVVLTLEICADARRTSSLIGRKCRASAVRVLSASDGGSGPYYSKYDNTFVYRVGEIASVDDFDDDIRVECTRGIHFFITRQEAENYS